MQSSVFRLLRDTTNDEAPTREKRWELYWTLVEIENISG